MSASWDDNERSNESHGRASQSRREIYSPERKEPLNDKRREAADKSLLAFLEGYFKPAFPLDWSQDHRDVIEVLQRVITDGGLFALAMPRGSGKTTITARAALWALMTRRRQFVEIVAGTEGAAKKIIKAIKSELSWNPLLRQDYPFEMHGLHQLKGDNRKSAGQICGGEKTGVVLGINEIVFPTHKYSPIGGAMVFATGLTGNVRGPNHTKMDGTVIRPDFVMLDDPQTRESATSRAQTEERIEIVEGDVLGLAGPGKSIAAVMPCTVIARGDLADHFLNHPQWQSMRAQLLPKFPKNMALWDKYFEVRAEGLRVAKSNQPANDWYVANREQLDDGAVASWPARKEPTEISAVQSAMHLWYRSPSAFAAEYNNQPLDAGKSADSPTYAGLITKLTRLEKGIAPIWATKVTMGIDVQQRALFWLMVAWADDFTGTIIDYGAWPRQQRSYYQLSDLNPSLQQASGLSQLEGALRWGLDGLTNDILPKPVKREDGGQISISKAIIDANWGPSTDTVYEFCRRTPFSAMVIPSHGRGIKAGDRPMCEWPAKPGETHGWNWILTSGQSQRAVRHILFDTNFWKTTIAGRCSAAAGEKGALSLFGQHQEQHRMLMDHLSAESAEETSGRGRELWEWRCRPNADNHWLDCLSMAAVAASTLGCVVSGATRAADPPKKVRFSDLQRQKGA